MKIVNWNVEKVNKKHKIEILRILENLDADIIVLTETKNTLSLKNYFSVQTTVLPDIHEGQIYSEGENRVTIWSKNKINIANETHDHFTSIFAETTISNQQFFIYGCIIGTQSNKNPFFTNELNGFLSDLNKLFEKKTIICIGDFNTTLQGRPWPSSFAQESLLTAFESQELEILTKELPVCIDHITISKDFLKNKNITNIIWNEDKKLSDHYGICITIQ